MDNIVSQVVYESAQRHGDRVAIVTAAGEELTYAQLAQAVGQLAGHLRGQGILPGQVVGISMPGNPLHLLTLLALSQVGAVVLPLHPAVPADRRRLAARRFGATCVVSHREKFAIEGLSFVAIDRTRIAADAAVDSAIHPAAPDDPMYLLLSSGTSGNPKAMTWTHRNISLRNQTVEPEGPRQKRVLPLDLNFFAGVGPAMRALAHGDALVFPASMTPEDVLLALLVREVSHAYVSPHQAERLANLVGEDVDNACPHLVSLRIVGEHLTAQSWEKLSQRLTPNIYVVYGTSEAGVITLATPEMLKRQPETVGPACPWAEVQIVDESDEAVPLHTIGEVRIRSGQLVLGYSGDDRRNRTNFRNGWFYPGDRGRLDDKGWLYIEGRIDDMINVGGDMVDAHDIESVLCSHPAVIEAAAFLSMAPDGQSFVSAAVVPTDDRRLSEVCSYAESRLGPLAPVRYVLASTLPRTQTGKIQRNMLASSFPVPRSWSVEARVV